MFGTLGGPELLLILVIALIVFGPRKLPEIGKSLGKMMVEFRKASTDFRQTIESEIEADKLKQMMAETPRIAAPGPPAPAASPGTEPAEAPPAAPSVEPAGATVSRET